MTRMLDGLYRVEYNNICAGFVIENGRMVMIAPILVGNAWLQRKAVKVGG